MKLLFTGAPKCGDPQTNPRLSLGGFVSSTQISNDELNNVFSQISELTRQNLTREAILIAIKNDSTSNYEGITITFDIDFDNSVAEYEIAFVGSSKDNCDCDIYQSIDSSSGKPYVTLDLITDGDNEFTINSLLAGQTIGMWLIRNLVKDKIKAKSCAELYTDFQNNTSQETEENFDINFSWTEVQPSGSSS